VCVTESQCSDTKNPKIVIMTGPILTPVALVAAWVLAYLEKISLVAFLAALRFAAPRRLIQRSRQPLHRRECIVQQLSLYCRRLDTKAPGLDRADTDHWHGWHCQRGQRGCLGRPGLRLRRPRAAWWWRWWRWWWWFLGVRGAAVDGGGM
jgi:hypothetical protein